MARGYSYRSRSDARFYNLLVVGVAAALALGSFVDLPTLGSGDGATLSAPPLEAGATTSEPVFAAGVTRNFTMCHTGGGTNCVVDGDTFWMDGEKVRIADIDTPETHPARCAEEARLGAAATERLRALLNSGPVELVTADRDTDRYGRKLRIVSRGGQSLGAILIDEGLARPWAGQRRPWCAV